MNSRKFESSFGIMALIGAAAIGAVLWRSPVLAAEAPVVIAPPVVDNPKAAGPAQTAVLSGGCFWVCKGSLSTCAGCSEWWPATPAAKRDGAV